MNLCAEKVTSLLTFRRVSFGERTLAACWSPHSAATNFVEDGIVSVAHQQRSAVLGKFVKATCLHQHAGCVRSPKFYRIAKAMRGRMRTPKASAKCGDVVLSISHEVLLEYDASPRRFHSSRSRVWSEPILTLATLCHYLRSGPVGLNLRCHFLQTCSKRFNLPLQTCNSRFQFLDFAMFFEEFVEQHRVHLLIANRFGLAVRIASHQIGIHFSYLLGDQAKSNGLRSI
jgi:hypothetical protein